MALAQPLLPSTEDAEAELAAALILDLERADARVIRQGWVHIGIDRLGVHALILTPGYNRVTRYPIGALRLAVEAIRRDPPWSSPVTTAVLRILGLRLQLADAIGGTV